MKLDCLDSRIGSKCFCVRVRSVSPTNIIHTVDAMTAHIGSLTLGYKRHEGPTLVCVLISTLKRPRQILKNLIVSWSTVGYQRYL